MVNGYNNSQITSWPIFLYSVQIAPSQFGDPQGALFGLTQTASFRQYQCQFESLSNRVIGLPHNFLLSCFTSGLKPHIRSEVQAL